MPFTPQQEAQIIQALNNLSDSEKRKHSENTNATLVFISGFLGSSATEYVLKTHGWPVVERKIIEIWKKLR